jgi:Protein of unknown function (DUF1553)/Protein of unknown function (DUF1549)/Concanavalin A-like lectin/glucanases superfamily/Planctomycete cytochrome C
MPAVKILPFDRLLLLVVLLVSTALASAVAADDASAAIRFNRDIRPILAENCYHCHGPDPGSRKAKLRFDREDGFFAKHGDDDPTVVKGKPEDSELYKRIITTVEDDVMPPPKEKKVLTPVQKDLLKRWIAQGAPVEPHWSFIKPERPELPPVANAAWVKNPIDRFVAARLQSAGLAPAPEADRRTLARRVCLDLTGLPPEPVVVEAFVADGAADAYERLVDQLLSSPRYGEHRARYWLDAARYADTHGMHFDNYREMWPYRDWVINAFNSDQPFDQFTIEQLAGDLLPHPSESQLIATGFHRCNMTTNEGGTIEEENLCNYARDRVETTSWVWLGLTSNCAVCHDHKFDPIPTKDFYAMSAFFRNTTQGGLDGNIKDTAPILRILKGDDQGKMKSLDEHIGADKQLVADRRKALRSGFDAWLAKATVAEWDATLEAKEAPSLSLPLTQAPEKGKGEAGAKPDGSISGLYRGNTVYLKTIETISWEDGGKFGKVPRITEKSAMSLDGDVGDFERDKPYSFGCWVKMPKDFSGSAAIISRMDNEDGYRGWDLYAQGNEFATHLIHHWSDDALKVHCKDNCLKRDTWQHVFVTYDGSGKAAGLHIFVDGKLVRTETEADTLKSTTHTGAPFFVGRRKSSDILKSGLVQDVRVYNRRLEADEIARQAFTPRAHTILAQAADKRSAKEKDEFFDIYIAGDASLKTSDDQIAALEQERKELVDHNPVTHVMQEKANSQPIAHILFRGQYDQPKDEVKAAVYSALHPLPAGAPNNRLGLALWLVSKEDALMPRVVINRFWQEVFGSGLVRTAEDFGIMGDPPSHPELLDWLAVEFRDGGWDVKKMIRLMVTSATYRQAALATPDKIEKDPANRLLSRGPRFRMDAEMIRDYALAASASLSTTMGGPSVKPYQPDGVWDAVGMRESNTKLYKRDSGDALYRRSVYTFWKRMAPPPSMEIFNAPNREVSCLRRERTDTPLQALVTLNDPQFIEAARRLAQLALSEPGDDAHRIDLLARRILARPFSAKETAVVQAILVRLRSGYQGKADEAKALIAVGESKPDAKLDPSELAAWTMLDNELFNLDETLNK